jgi:hypothetical protein
MTTHSSPFRTTIVYGLACALAFIPLYLVSEHVTDWPRSFFLAAWALMAGYFYLLTRWSDRRAGNIGFPLLLLLMAAFLGDSPAAFGMFALTTLAWVRSVICFSSCGNRLVAETIACLGGGSLPAIFGPVSVVSWALCIWMFFLVQSLYFLFNAKEEERESRSRRDPFVRARLQAEKILGED